MNIRINQKHKKTSSLLVLSLIMLLNFQNCSQPGQINVASKPSEPTALSLPENPEDPVPEIPVPEMPPTVQYKNLNKTLNVTESSGKVDILVVIDNSGSMSYEQKNMADRFGTLIDKLRGLDWQIGIVTTDVGSDADLKDGRLIKFRGLNKYILNSADNILDAKKAFADTIQRPINEGSSLEQGIRATYRAFERSLALGENQNAGLIRNGSAVSVIVVTDADETVANGANGAQLAGDETTFTVRNFPLKLKNYFDVTFTTNTLKFNSIIVKPNDQACLTNRMTTVVNGSTITNSNEGYGNHYKQMSDLTSGIIGDVCAADYGDQLQIIGQSVVDQVKETLLECAPVDANGDSKPDIIIRNASNTVLMNYTVNGNKVTFADLLPASTYSISYVCVK